MPNNKILGLEKLAVFIRNFLEKNPENYNKKEEQLAMLMKYSEAENSWFIQENQRYNLKHWANLLSEDSIRKWLSKYEFGNSQKKIGLILAGNIPLVGFHDVISVILSNHFPIIKLSSKDRLLLPFLLDLWKKFSNNEIDFEFAEKLENFDAVIATGSNNTAQYLEYYFKDYPVIIRKNRTSVAILKGDESDEELRLLAKDIFLYFGLGCRNVTQIFIPKDFKIDRLFENFLDYREIINHHKYANNYDYNRAMYLLNQEKFWDNNFVMLKENSNLFCPLSVVHFSRYENSDEIKSFLEYHQEDIQAIIAKPELGFDSIRFGESQNPSLDTYADNVDTLDFLISL